MTTEQAIKLMHVEMTCIERASNIDHPCTRECETCELIQKSEDLIEAYDMSVDALRSQQWISVNDGLPEKTGSYLVFYHEWSDGAFLPTYEDFKIRVMRFLNSRKWCYPVCVDKRCEADTNREVTHWMPLPDPPKEVQHDN